MSASVDKSPEMVASLLNYLLWRNSRHSRHSQHFRHRIAAAAPESDSKSPVRLATGPTRVSPRRRPGSLPNSASSSAKSLPRSLRRAAPAGPCYQRVPRTALPGPLLLRSLFWLLSNSALSLPDLSTYQFTLYPVHPVRRKTASHHIPASSFSTFLSVWSASG
jgi:hypothetical protein